MKLSIEVTMLLMYSIALMMIFLGVAINSRRVHRKLNRILSLLATDKDNEHNISYGKNKRQNILPAQSNLATPKNGDRDKPEKKNCNGAYGRAFAHIKSIAQVIKR